MTETPRFRRPRPRADAIDLGPDLADPLRAAWQRYVDLLEPIRSDLYRYCRRLTGNVWDAEDLVQDTLVRAFATLGKTDRGVSHPRAYLLRTATHAWIDALRRRDREVTTDLDEVSSAASAVGAGEVRDAAAALLQRLSPRERAALILKEVFQLSVAETAEVLQTTPGAVKSALHRARGQLEQGPAAATRPAPPLALVDRFVERFNAADLDGLVELVLEDASVELLGCGYATGRDTLREGFFTKALHGHPEWPEVFQYEAARLERALLEGEPVALALVVRRGDEALEQAFRFEEADGKVARILCYAFCPDAMREIGEALGVPVRTGLYRYPTPAPGRSW